ncbi:MAG: efflux RND transporter periplasmic adaptor subunit [Flavobacteriales bacterium]|jgi:cobalt-zinc-cadmium efflux system membrane fusion protein
MISTLYPYALGIILFLPACSQLPENATSTRDSSSPQAELVLSESQERVSPITCSVPVRRMMRKEVLLRGESALMPGGSYAISSPFGGTIRALEVMVGQPVQKGMILAVLENPEFISIQEDYLSALTRLAVAEAEWKRQQDLLASKATSERQAELATGDMKAAKLAVAAGAERMRLIGLEPDSFTIGQVSSRISLRAASGGIVSGVNGIPGRFAEAAQPIVEVVNPSAVVATLVVYERDWPGIKPGQEVILSSPGWGEWSGQVKYVGGALGSQKSTVVQCLADDAARMPMPGTLVEGRVHLAGYEAWAVPEAAVMREDGKAFVFLRKAPRTYSMTAVETGVVSDGYVELVNFAPGSTAEVVTGNAFILLNTLRNVPDE